MIDKNLKDEIEYLLYIASDLENAVECLLEELEKNKFMDNEKQIVLLISDIDEMFDSRFKEAMNDVRELIYSSELF